MEAPISEIFCSVQGEGPYVGSRQVFVRFTGCNLDCPYCDTPCDETSSCKFEEVPGSGMFTDVTNSISVEKLSEMVSSFKKVHSVSLTGGEPLLNADFISELELEYPLYLESNMTLPDMARKVKDKISYVSGDVKLLPRSSVDNFELHIENTIECFRILQATNDRDCFAKIVVSKDTNAEDIESVIGDISGYISCLVLQPVTQKELLPNPNYLLELQEKLLDYVDTIIIPQTHVMWGCL
ncbi:7-carboxy-7-deazaguanine synthase QueE [Methanolobus sp. ZRKC3]|uniref:7-carboxy-7-deazaguanine synthase QueE n=1 Tax=Methanolobus sp. ZRKC3 TaxID=3125786 RepID=UPI003250D27F